MITDGFDSPVGDAEERRSDKVLPGKWLDANPYGTFYNVTPTRQAWHTGADLNLPEDRDAHAPVYAIGNGRVTYAQMGGGTWGKLVVIAHVLPSRETIYSRYAHLETIGVQFGQTVKRGDEIGRIGSAENRFPYHLHFDISLTSTLGKSPEDWPGTDETRLRRDYVAPLTFIRSNRPMQQPPVITPADMIRAIQDALAQINSTLQQLSAALTPAPTTPPGDARRATVASDIGLNARNAPNLRGAIMAKIPNGETLVVTDAGSADGYDWCKIAEGQYAGWYVARTYLVFTAAEPVADDAAAVG